MPTRPISEHIVCPTPFAAAAREFNPIAVEFCEAGVGWSTVRSTKHHALLWCSMYWGDWLVLWESEQRLPACVRFQTICKISGIRRQIMCESELYGVQKSKNSTLFIASPCSCECACMCVTFSLSIIHVKKDFNFKKSHQRNRFGAWSSIFKEPAQNNRSASARNKISAQRINRSLCGHKYTHSHTPLSFDCAGYASCVM